MAKPMLNIWNIMQYVWSYSCSLFPPVTSFLPNVALAVLFRGGHTLISEQYAAGSTSQCRRGSPRGRPFLPQCWVRGRSVGRAGAFLLYRLHKWMLSSSVWEPGPGSISWLEVQTEHCTCFYHLSSPWRLCPGSAKLHSLLLLSF